MTSVSLWTNVDVDVQSALATAITIVGITKANPAVVTFNDTKPADGAYVVMTVSGMNQLDGRVFRVAGGVTGSPDSIQLEGCDSTLFDTFSSGTFQTITFGTSMTTATGLSASGGDFEFIDVTTIHDTIRKQVPGMASPAVYSFENIWDASDAALVALKAASEAQSLRAIKFGFANGAKVVFTGHIGCTLLPIGNAQDKVTTSVAVTMFGKPTVYAT